MALTYYEKIARIQLTTGKITTENTSADLASRFLGGRGLGAKLLADNIPASVDPLSPDNQMIISSGPMTCHLGPSEGRYSIVTKSPVNGRICASNSSGSFGEKMKYAGWDAIIIEGKASELSYLLIQDDTFELRNGNFLAQKLTDKTYEELKKIHGPNVTVLTIGPAGEDLETNAAIMENLERAAGKNAIGAVMGSKNLKAIVISSSRTDITPLLSRADELFLTRQEFSEHFQITKEYTSCKKCLLPCGRASGKKKDDPELLRCNQLGIDAAKKEKKSKYYAHMSQEDLYLNAVIDSIGLCMFAKSHIDAEQIARWLNAITGTHHTSDSLLICGKEICDLEEAFLLAAQKI